MCACIARKPPKAFCMSCRFKVLAECASYESWQKALAYHQEMRYHGKELPASELIEFVEVSREAPGPAFLQILT